MLGFLFAVLAAIPSFAQAPKMPALTSPVVDDAGILPNRDRRELEEWLFDYHRRGKAQIQVVIVQSLGGLPIEQYSIKLMENWKIGDAKRDNGVLFLAAMDERAMRLEVGQGLEGAITDAHSKRILDQRAQALFAAGKYGQGIVSVVVEVMRLADPEYTESGEGAEPSGKIKIPTWLIIILLILFMTIGGGRRRRRGLLGAFGGGFGGGYLGGGGFGGGGFGGGGGWSGGGGGFSGGGASSNW